MRSVQIGPEFFANEKRAYADWQMAFWREINQNSYDAGASNINASVSLEGSDTRVIVENDGDVMTEDVLINKLLCLGGTTKTGTNAVGAFGVAKQLLLMCHRTWSVQTGSLLAEGSGGSYELTHTTYFPGTRTNVLMYGNEVKNLSNKLVGFAAVTQRRGTLTFNGQILETNLHKGVPRREFEFGKVYTNKSYEELLVVRKSGIPMFIRHTDFKGCVIVELTGNSTDLLTSNRDGLKWEYQQELDDFITDLGQNRRKAFGSTARYRHYEGPRHTVARRVSASSLVGVTSMPVAALRQDTPSGRTDGPSLVLPDSPAASDPPATTGRQTAGGEAGTAVLERPKSKSSMAVLSVEQCKRAKSAKITEEFIVKNTIEGMEVPNYYLPDREEFGHYSQTLAKYWGRCLLTVHKLFDLTASFAIGFIVSDEAEAEREEGRYGLVYYLNPVVVTKQQNSESRSLKKRYNLSTCKNQIIMNAVHEVLHSIEESHNEQYASLITDWAAKAMDHRSEFNWCFK